jgi:hypothetical protein
MKMTAISIGRVLFLGIALIGPGRAQTNGYAFAQSPDHPKTWADGATRIHQSLRWSASKQTLFAEVTYSTADFADGPHPTQEDDFTLSFPTVRFDPASNKFTANGFVVARLHHGLFGSEILLDPKVQLSIHRHHHGVVYAALVPGDND